MTYKHGPRTERVIVPTPRIANYTQLIDYVSERFTSASREEEYTKHAYLWPWINTLLYNSYVRPPTLQQSLKTIQVMQVWCTMFEKNRDRRCLSMLTVTNYHIMLKEFLNIFAAIWFFYMSNISLLNLFILESVISVSIYILPCNRR